MHSATIFITLPDANPKSLVVRISFRVLDPIPPKLVVDSPRLTFTTPGPAILRSVLNVANGGGGTLSFSASSSTESGASWLAITPANSQATPSTPAQLLVSVDSASLTPGVYRGAVSVSAGTGEQSSTPVTLVVGGSRQQLLLSQRGMTFQASRDGGAPLPQSLSVLNRGQGALDWTARARSENSWLTISPAAGSVARPMLDSSAINVSADPTGLPAGVYYGRIEVFAGEGPAQSTTVVLNVTEADFAPAPQIQPAGLIFTGRTGDTPGSQNVTARNRAAAPLFYNSTGVTLDGADWLQYIPKNANIGTAQPQRVVVQPAFASIGPGVYDGAITFLFGESIHVVRVKTIVASQSCTPSRLILLPTSHEESFVAMQYLPVSLEVQVVDDCGNPLTADRAGASVTAGFSNGDQTINLIPTRGGFWSNTWQPVASANGPAFLTLRATLQQPNGLVLSTAAQLQANIAGESNVPVIRRQLNAASQMTDAPLAPGSLFTITGSALAGAAVSLGAEPVPTLLTSAAQINGQTPWDAPLNTEAELIVQRGNAISLPQPVVVAAASPAIFTQDGSGAGAGLIADAVTGLINGAANPAHAGDTIVIHATGLGSPDQQVTLNVADLPAEVVSVQQSSVVPGAFEITALVPETIEPGDALPVRITVAGQGSPAVTMVVR
jgi:uncharacterized protein (TIGR03437 family)